MKINIDAINKTSISSAKGYCFDFRPLWLIATDEGNTETLNCRYHNHAFYEIHIVTSGKLVYSFKDEELVLDKGQFSIIPPKCRHKVLSNSKNIGKFTLAFEINETSSLISAISRIKNKAVNLKETALGKFSEILKLCESRTPYKTEQLYLSLCSFLFDIAELGYLPDGATVHKPECDDRVIKAKKYIEDNFDVFFTCEEVALYCRMSEKQLGRLFRKFENMSLLEFIHMKKFEAIKNLLRDSEISHRKIAQTLGFSSAQYYGKFVSRMSGMTPEELRKSIVKKG